MEDLLDLHNKTPVWNDGRFINTNIKTLKSNIVLSYISSKFNFFYKIVSFCISVKLVRCIYVRKHMTNIEITDTKILL